MMLRKQLEAIGIKVFEAIPPMILDTELTPEERAKRQTGSMNIKVPTSQKYAEVVLKSIKDNTYKIGY